MYFVAMDQLLCATKECLAAAAEAVAAGAKRLSATDERGEKMVCVSFCGRDKQSHCRQAQGGSDCHKLGIEKVVTSLPCRI